MESPTNRQTERQEGSDALRAVKRRGILAAAGAVVAGIVARHVEQPVEANDGVWTFPYTGSTFSSPAFSVTSTGGIAIMAQGGGGPFPAGAGVATTGGHSTMAFSGGSGITAQGGTGGSSGDGGTGVNGQGGLSGGTGHGGYGVIGVGASQVNAIGVMGQAPGPNGIGLYGTGIAYGVRGDAGSAPGAAGLLGYSNQAGGVAFGTVIAAPATTAGYFGGRVVVNGDFAVTGTKNAAVKDATGNYRLMYCVESPESWFEDFGAGQLVGGKADVTLDPAFAALVHPEDYGVFLTPEGDSKGLYVTNKSTAGFSVREQQGGTSDLAFRWRLVSKRADIKGERLAKFTLPSVKLPEAVAPVISANPQPSPAPMPPAAPIPSQAQTPEPTIASPLPAPIPPRRP